MKKALIFITGLPGSGKSFAADMIRKHFHAKSFKPGDIVREEISRKGLDNTPENDMKMRLWFHRGREHIIAKRLWRKIRNEKGIVVIDGLRTPKHLSILKSLYKGQVIVIRMDSSFDKRSLRTIKRGRFGKLETSALLKSRDKSETQKLKGLIRVMKRADYSIDNSNLTKRQSERRIVSLVKAALK